MFNSLQNIDNYKSLHTNNCSEIFSKYILLINEYLMQYINAINMNKTDYYKYTIYKGITAIQNVFKIILLYTKNLNLAYYHSQKSYYYYVEFLEQISEDNHTFLQLCCKDAVLFVYKKTIFEINHDFKKNFSSIIGTDLIIENVEMFIHLYNNSLLSIIQNYEFDINNKLLLFKEFDNKLANCSQCLLNLSLDDDIVLNKNLKLINLLYTKLNKTNLEKINYIELLAKNIKKKQVKMDVFSDRLNDFDNNLEECAPNKYITWLIS